MDNLSLADLTVFTRAAALGTLSLAARERGVPVSQISRAVARVECVCGAQLFRRSARGITLTHDGEAFLVFCQKVLETRNDLEADLSRSRRQAAGERLCSCEPEFSDRPALGGAIAAALGPAPSPARTRLAG